MVVFPAWIANILFLATFYLSIYQHVRMREIKPTLNLQFFMAVFSLLMVLVVTFQNGRSPWLSLTFLVVAILCLAGTYRQLRYMPPKRY